MPRTLLKRAWAAGIQRPEDVARHFDVSPRAAEVRLTLVGLLEPKQRDVPRSIAAPRLPDNPYFRARSLDWPFHRTEEIRS